MSTDIMKHIDEQTETDGEFNLTHFSVTPAVSPPLLAVDLTVTTDVPTPQPNTNSSQPVVGVHRRQPQGRFGGKPQSSYQ